MPECACGCISGNTADLAKLAEIPAYDLRSLLDEALALLEVDDEVNTPGTDTYTFIVTAKDALRQIDAARAGAEDAISAKAREMCAEHCEWAEGSNACSKCTAEQEGDWRSDAEVALKTALATGGARHG